MTNELASHDKPSWEGITETRWRFLSSASYQIPTPNLP